MHLAPARRLKWPPFARLPASSFIFQLSCSQLPAAGCLSSALSSRPAVLPSALSCPVLPGWPDYSSASQLSLCLASKLSPFTLLLLLQQLLLLPLLSLSTPSFSAYSSSRYRPCAALYLNYCNDLHWSGCCNIRGTVAPWLGSPR